MSGPDRFAERVVEERGSVLSLARVDALLAGRVAADDIEPRSRELEDERPGLDELRRALDAGELGREGFHTVLRLGGTSLTELKRIVFQRPPRGD